MVKTYEFVTGVRGLSGFAKNSILHRVAFDEMKGGYVTTKDYLDLKELYDEIRENAVPVSEFVRLQEKNKALTEELATLKSSPQKRRRRSSNQETETDNIDEL